MHIAQVAPLTEAVPPKLYGGTERVVSWLTEELIALGHEVTLFASGDSVTSAKLEAMWPRALRLDGAVRDPNALHMMMLEQVYRPLVGLRYSALPSRLLSILAVLTPSHAVRRPRLHGRLDLPEHQPIFDTFNIGTGGFDFEFAAAAVAAGELGAHRAIMDCRRTCWFPGRSSRVTSRFSAASRRRRASSAPSVSRSIAA